MKKNDRSTPVPYSTRVAHIKRFAEIYDKDTSRQNIIEYVDMFISHKPLTSEDQFKKNVAKMYNWVHRDHVDELNKFINNKVYVNRPVLEFSVEDIEDEEIVEDELTNVEAIREIVSKVNITSKSEKLAFINWLLD